MTKLAYNVTSLTLTTSTPPSPHATTTSIHPNQEPSTLWLLHMQLSISCINAVMIDHVSRILVIAQDSWEMCSGGASV